MTNHTWLCSLKKATHLTENKVNNITVLSLILSPERATENSLKNLTDVTNGNGNTDPETPNEDKLATTETIDLGKGTE